MALIEPNEKKRKRDIVAKKIFKAVHPFDWLIAVAAIIIFAKLNFAELTTVDIIYIVTFVVWAILFALRIFIVLRQNGGGS